jgi:hypothetical protein
MATITTEALLRVNVLQVVHRNSDTIAARRAPCWMLRDV